MASRLLSLWRLPFLQFKNRNKHRLKRFSTYMLPAISLLFAVALFLGTKKVVIEKVNGVSDQELLVSIQLTALALMLMLVFGNFATALQGFFGANDIPYLLALPVKRSEFLLGRAASTIWNGSSIALLFCFPLCLGYLVGTGGGFWALTATLFSLLILTLISGLVGISCATLFVNLIPTSRMFEFFIVLLVAFILFTAILAPEIGGNVTSARVQFVDVASQLENNSLNFLDHTPPGLLARIMIGSKNGEVMLYPLLHLIIIFLGVMCVSTFIFSKLFQRGWNLTLAGRATQRTVGHIAHSRRYGVIDQQLFAMMTKELKMFIRDPAQAVQFLVILLLTFLYLFNLKNLRNLSFSVEEGSYWWHATLGLANVSMGGCVAAAMATRFVYPSVSLEGRAYPLLVVTPMSLPRLLYAKCVAWFWPTCLVNTILLLSGALALQLPPLALLYTVLVSFSLSLGLVGLGVGMGAIYARFDWDQSSSLNSSLGALLYMIFSFVLILITLLPASFLFITACIPAFTQKLSLPMIVGPIAVAVLILLLINILVARGSLRSGVERLQSITN